MSNFNDNKELAVAVLAANPQQSIYVQGAPGNGKTSLIYAVAKALGIAKENVIIFRPSLHDPVDLLGIPHVNGDKCTHWAPPLWVHNMKSGRYMLGIDELPQGQIMMQNALAGLMLDRFIGEVTLSRDVVIMATGNRTTDKAGANRVVGQLANRVLMLEMESSLDGWCEWAMEQGNIPSWYIQFLRFRPNLLNDYQPDRFSNPTERTHQMVATLPSSLTPSQLFNAAKGLIGEGAAAEMVGFKKIADAMPNIDGIMLAPDAGTVPTDPATLYAVSGALAFRAAKDNFDRIATYLKRLPPEFLVMSWRDSYKLCPEISSSKAFVELATKYGTVLTG
jgi:hypothetical protein